MSPKRVKPRHVELKVVIDTNALYTGSASNFLRKEVADLISQNLNPLDLTIRWIVPEVVRHERQFQMIQEASQMLPTIEKLERLLGHNLNITKEILNARVKEAVDAQVEQHGIVVQPLNSAAVDWPRVILDASYRRPPFQLGEKEKGFRDALILETFLQIVASSPTSRSVARLALVSGDQLLRDAALSRLASATNVHLLESIDALKDLINTIGSAVDEQFIAAIKERAADVFFKRGDENTLYYKESVGARLEQALRGAPLKLTAGADKYKIDKWTIGAPRFVKKQGQRIYWATRFEATLNALKSAEQPEWTKGYSNVTLANLLNPNASQLPAGDLTYISPVSSNIFAQRALPTYVENFQTFDSGPIFNADDQVVGHGTATLNTSWSLAVTTSGTLTKPKLESVEFIEVVWR
ncbi:MAG: PIN domain-containing protein [Terriglobales bacterium]